VAKFGAFDVKRPVSIVHGDTDLTRLPVGRFEPSSLEELEALRHVEATVPGTVESIEAPNLEVEEIAGGLPASEDNEPILPDASGYEPPSGDTGTSSPPAATSDSSSDDTDTDSPSDDTDTADHKEI
jgi:hypothetical protein